MNKLAVKILPVLGLILLLNSTLQAQSYFMLPSDFFPPKGGKISIGVFNGKGFDSVSSKPIPLAEMSDISLYAGSKPVNLKTAFKPQDLQIAVDMQESGLSMLTASRELVIDNLDREDLMRQLSDEGFPKLVEKADEKEELGIRNKFCMKTLVMTAKPSGGLYSDKTNQELEIIPQQNPYKLKYGEDVTFLVLFKGNPLPNATAQIFTRTLNGSIIPAESTTDADGKIYLKLNRSGQWLLKVIHIQPIPNAPEKGPDYDRWCSSFTFSFRS